jgi:hypothetical protein
MGNVVDFFYCPKYYFQTLLRGSRDSIWGKRALQQSDSEL